jgi:hypothetical protein
MKPKLKPTGSKHLKLTYDEAPSNFAFKFSLRPYTMAKLLGAMARARAIPT